MGRIKTIITKIDQQTEFLDMVETMEELGNQVLGVNRSLAAYKGQVNTLKERIDYLEQIIMDAATQEETQQEET